MVATLLTFIGVVSLFLPNLTYCEVSITTKQVGLIDVKPTLSGSDIQNRVLTNNNIHNEVNDDNSRNDSPSVRGSDVNLAFLPGFALLCFIVAVLFRVCKWQRESAKFKDRGCSYDIASYVILVQGDKDFHDIDARTDCTSNFDTVTSFSSIVRLNGYHETITSCRSLQYRIDSKAYDTVTSYQTFLYKKQKEKLNHTTDTSEESKRPRAENCNNSMTIQEVKGNETPKLHRGSRFSVVPAIDNYMRLKESVTFSKCPITQPSTTRKNESENYVSPKILKRSISDSPTRSTRKGSKKIKSKSTESHTLFRKQDLERHASVKSDITHWKKRFQQQSPVMVNAETQIEYPFKRSKSAKYTTATKNAKYSNITPYAKPKSNFSTKCVNVEQETSITSHDSLHDSLTESPLKDNNCTQGEHVIQTPVVHSSNEQRGKHVISVSATVHDVPDQIRVIRDSTEDAFIESRVNELHSHKDRTEKTGDEHIPHSSYQLCSSMSQCSCYSILSQSDSTKHPCENIVQREENGVCLCIQDSDNTSSSGDVDDDRYQNVTDSGFMENDLKTKQRIYKKSCSDCTCQYVSEKSETIENVNIECLLSNSMSKTNNLKNSMSNSDSVNLCSSASTLSLSCSDSELVDIDDNFQKHQENYCSPLRTEV